MLWLCERFVDTIRLELIEEEVLVHVWSKEQLPAVKNFRRLAIERGWNLRGQAVTTFVTEQMVKFNVGAADSTKQAQIALITTKAMFK